ncbi:kunitz-like toxin PcKuz3 [Dermacentor albipictus]|uniref:kunitz-like toxin PcKuz3 n=1 Tax=Dermacentor albipictus TaxID=60249 RepID=UPI0031FC4DDD
MKILVLLALLCSVLGSFNSAIVDDNEALELPWWPFSLPEDCSYPPETGPCEAYMQRFYYNPLTKACEVFIFGGCGGNANNYATYKECQKKCKTIWGILPRA